MYTKSIIQQTVENIKAKECFRSALENLMEKYNIEDSVFALKNGFLHEATTGYFVLENTYDSIADAISDCNIDSMCLRIINNTSFQIGKLYNTLSECKGDKKVFDLDRLEEVR